MISAVVLTKNEEKNIVDCIDLLAWCDEIIIVDDHSEDRTFELVKNIKNKKISVLNRDLNNNFSAQRNFALSKAKNAWVLFVDADERVPKALALEISNIQFQMSNKYQGFYIRRRDVIWGKELRHGETGNIKLLRLAKKDAGLWEGKVHERWKINGDKGELKNPLIHYPHTTVKEFLKEINYYTDIRANELFEQGVKTNCIIIFVYPLVKFLNNYFIKLGFLDGIEGLIFATLMSFHSFLVRGKLWHNAKK